MRLIDADAIDEEQRQAHGFFYDFDLQELLDEQPTIQPQLIRCKDCKYYHSHYCEMWSKYGTIQTKKDGYCYMAERATV